MLPALPYLQATAKFMAGIFFLTQMIDRMIEKKYWRAAVAVILSIFTILTACHILWGWPV
jgi:hypothetical protein